MVRCTEEEEETLFLFRPHLRSHKAGSSISLSIQLEVAYITGVERGSSVVSAHPFGMPSFGVRSPDQACYIR